MRLLPSVVHGLMIAKSVVRWGNGKYYDISYRPLSFHLSIPYCRKSRPKHPMSWWCTVPVRSTSISDDSSTAIDSLDEEEGLERTPSKIPVWNHPAIRATVAKKKRNNNLRFRQHVNPLSRLYQQPTILPENWPTSVYTNVYQRPLHLDIGCGKGGFLIELCQVENASNDESTSSNYNYLGLEIRPGVAAYAKDRILVHQLQGQLDFLGCNANVDLDRILALYQSQYSTDPSSLCLHRVTIQFPDPHFKTQHIKRRVVTKKLVDTFAKYMPKDGKIILQSDVQSVLDDMRRQFREANASIRSIEANELSSINSEEYMDVKRHQSMTSTYFIDSIKDTNMYIPENVLGVPTEREQSVLVQALPVYRSLLTRNDCPYQN
jgi:tRNA (guanine-N7-)-methyltransferase